MTLLNPIGRRLPYIVAVIVTVSVLVLLRTLNAESRVSLVDLTSRTIAFEVVGQNIAAPFMNETAPAKVVVLRGFEVDLVGPLPSLQDTAAPKLPIKVGYLELRRSDQLHIKELFARPGTQLLLSLQSDVLGIAIVGEPNCCKGKIGVGNAVKVELNGQTVDGFGGTEAITTSEPNISFYCREPPCSLTVHLNTETVDGLIEARKVKLFHFERPGSRRPGSEVGESTLLAGKVVVSSVDLLGNEFTLRDIMLARGALVQFDRSGSARISVDARGDTLLTTAELHRQTSLKIGSRAGEMRDVMPTLLEVLLREPWRPSIVAIFFGVVPVLATWGLRWRSKRLRSGGHDA